MSPKAIIDRISNEKDAELARNALEHLKNNLYMEIMELESLIPAEENDLVAVGKQRAYRSIRMILTK